MRLASAALLASTCLVAAPPLAAQAPDGSASRAAIARLDFMVGRWTGEAWMLRGSERVQTAMSETVERKLGGATLLVEGIGTIPATGTAPAREVHHALAVVSYDPQANTYTLRSYLASGQSGDFVLTPVDGGVQWSRQVPGGQIRNTAKIGNGEWYEVGEFSGDGTTWTTIMELKLRRDPQG